MAEKNNHNILGVVEGRKTSRMECCTSCETQSQTPLATVLLQKRFSIWEDKLVQLGLQKRQNNTECGGNTAEELQK